MFEPTHARPFLPFALPSLGDEEIEEVCDALRSGWLTTGIKTKKFEDDFSLFVCAKHALAVNSATSGLHLALEAIGIGPGDKVLTTPYTFTATAEVIRYLGADPLFVDIDRRTYNIGPVAIRKALESVNGVKAILPVHFAGLACDMSAIFEVAKEYNLKVVEDAAHALPCRHNGRLIGSLDSDITVFSFYATKTITTGEGGMVVTNNPSYAERMRTMRLHGINSDVFDRYSATKPSWYYEVVAPGFKYNMTDIAAAIGIHQLKKTYIFHEQRERIARRYDEAFADLPIRVPFPGSANDIHARHLYVIQLELEQLNISRDRFIELMAEAGIGTSVHFIPLHIHPYWRDRYHHQPQDFPIAYDVYTRAVSLPIYPRMTDNDVGRVIEGVKDVIQKHYKSKHHCVASTVC